MIRALILYYLSIKPTHGYDIQRFIEINGMDKWARIQSGSIYYALSKLQKENLIYILKEETTGSRIRKIYAITEDGKKELTNILKEELLKPISYVESDKFIVHTMLNRLSKEEIISNVAKHIEVLNGKKLWWQCGKKLRMVENALKIDLLNFDMVISSLDYQIKWHETLLEELDKIYASSFSIEKLINNIDFSSLNDVKFIDTLNYESKINELKQNIIENPDNLETKIDELIKLLKN